MESCFVKDLKNELKICKSYTFKYIFNNTLLKYNIYLNNKYLIFGSNNSDFILNRLQNNFNINCCLKLYKFLIFQQYATINYYSKYLIQYALPYNDIKYYISHYDNKSNSDTLSLLKLFLLNKYNINTFDYISYLSDDNKIIVIDNIIFQNKEIYNYLLFNINSISNNVIINIDFELPTNDLRSKMTINIF